MPNHVTNIVKVTNFGGHSAKEILKRCVNESHHFDFELIIPMPEGMKDFHPHLGIISRAENAIGVELKDQSDGLNALIQALSKKNRIDDCFRPAKAEDLPLIIQAIQNYIDNGYFYWHDFSINKWGTKWNAYGQNDDPKCLVTGITFETAWSTPKNIYLALSAIFPEATFEIQYADEDMGSNCGTIVYQNGELKSFDIAGSYSEMSKEDQLKWLSFACTVRGRDYEEYLAEMSSDEE